MGTIGEIKIPKKYQDRVDSFWREHWMPEDVTMYRISFKDGWKDEYGYGLDSAESYREALEMMREATFVGEED